MRFALLDEIFVPNSMRWLTLGIEKCQRDDS